MTLTKSLVRGRSMRPKSLIRCNQTLVPDQYEEIEQESDKDKN